MWLGLVERWVSYLIGTGAYLMLCVSRWRDIHLYTVVGVLGTLQRIYFGRTVLRIILIAL
jgi:hypothetical protein